MVTRISGPVAVIGDVHGQVEQLGDLLSQILDLPGSEQRWIVFIGDLVDRGPDPRGAIEMVLQLRRSHPRTAMIAGNHELAMSAALGLVPVPDVSDWSERWLDHYGSQATFDSYGVDYPNLERLSTVLPQSHQEYLANVPWCVEHPDYFFVHAGLDPHCSFAMQRDILRSRDFTLRRPQWLSSKRLTFESPPADCSQTVVSGHVRVPEVIFGERRILIDTSGGRGGVLSGVLLPENQVLQAGDPQNEHTPGERVASASA